MHRKLQSLLLRRALVQPAIRFLLLCLALSASPCLSAQASAKLSVWPAFASLHTNAAQQFTATLTGSSEAVTWQVNGVAGGNSTVGKVTANGLTPRLLMYPLAPRSCSAHPPAGLSR